MRVKALVTELNNIFNQKDCSKLQAIKLMKEFYKTNRNSKHIGLRESKDIVDQYWYYNKDISVGTRIVNEMIDKGFIINHKRF